MQPQNTRLTSMRLEVIRKRQAKAREEYEAEVTKITREAEMNRLQTAVNVAQSILDKTESLEAEGLVSKEEVEEAQAKIR